LIQIEYTKEAISSTEYTMQQRWDVKFKENVYKYLAWIAAVASSILSQ
jgi:hypothetical protein